MRGRGATRQDYITTEHGTHTSLRRETCERRPMPCLAGREKKSRRLPVAASSCTRCCGRRTQVYLDAITSSTNNRSNGALARTRLLFAP